MLQATNKFKELEEVTYPAPNDTAYTWWSGGAVTVIWQTAVQTVQTPPNPNNKGPIFRFWGQPVMQTHWMVGTAPHKTRRCRY